LTIGTEWLAAFPVRPAREAAEALCDSFRALALRPLPGFNPKKREPELTRVLKAHVEQVTARERGLLGMWATEGVINTIELSSAQIEEERRTDIVYGWNNETVGIQLVFEFKKMSRSARDRAHYLGENGLARFVTGVYSRGQAVAAMVAILTDPVEEVVPPLCEALNSAASVAELKLRHRPDGNTYERPSLLFPAADFDTEHDRNTELAPAHGTIRVAHFFLAFAYAVDKTRKRSQGSKGRSSGKG
jgi:hypothetical protein